MAYTVRPIVPSDLPEVVDVWQAAFGATWPMARETLGVVSGFLAEDRAGIAGVALCDDWALLVLYTRPDVQGSGIAECLHGQVLTAAQAAGRSLHLGAGRRYFWPGVPTESLAALAFFTAQGWVWDHEVADLVGKIASLALPPARAIDLAGQVVTLADIPSAGPLTMFIERDFPQWAAHYAAARPDRVLVALDAGVVVGAALLTPPDDPTDPVAWRDAFGSGVGALGAVGVSPTVEGRGVGSQLVVAGAKRLAAVGATHLYLGWVWRSSFYERLGCQVWRRYRVAAPRGPAS